uniref:Fibronectin type-III domain-containing protein n=1 Tax=Timema tahoe TaxID=61484 RepID=A0A7R9NYB4_9NEOP|nr:unnamed protein product [Timema tahoe]
MGVHGRPRSPGKHCYEQMAIVKSVKMWPYCCVMLIVLFAGPGLAADCTGYVLEQIHSLVLGYDGGSWFVLRWQTPTDMTCTNRYCVCWTKLGETKEHCFHITTGYLSYMADANIEPCTNYTVKVSAINTNYHLYSHNVSIQFRTRPKDVTYLKVQSKSDTSLNIVWNNTYTNKCTTNYNVSWINLNTGQVKYSINSANKLYHNITGLKACTLYEYDVDTLADLGQHSGVTGRVSKTDGQVKYSINSANKLYHNITGLKACTLYEYDVDTLADLGQHSGVTGRVSKTDDLRQSGQSRDKLNFSRTARAEESEIFKLD